jgi:tRNA threonylcarbamoyladenosine biosynthesis protein TsaB
MILNANLLAIDTATEACSVALCFDGRLFERFEVCPRDHTKKLLPFVQEVLQEAEISLSQLDAIVFGQGPGSFTGVRIGVSAAQGLAFGAGLPVIGVSTLQAMAQQAARLEDAKRVVAAIDARMGEVYLGLYQLHDGLMVQEGVERVISPGAIVGEDDVSIAVGTGWQAYPEALAACYPNSMMNERILLPSARDMLDIAQYAYREKNGLPPEQAQPVYLRDKVTWKKLPGRE